MEMPFFTENPELVWLAIGFTLVAIELSVAPGIGLLFVGLGAITLGGVMAFEILELNDITMQLVYFCGFTIVWTLALWGPLKKYLRSSTGTFDMYVGTIATVQKGGLAKNKTGTVRWSGANMRARVRHKSSDATLVDGDEVYIHAMKNGIMFVDKQPVRKEKIAEHK